MPDQGKCSSMGWATMLGQQQQKRLVAAAKNSVEESVEQKQKSHSSGNKAHQSNLLCYSVLLAERQKCEILHSWHAQTPSPWDRNSWKR